MRTSSILSIAALLASAGFVQAQVPGPHLTPPGAPADGVFKTLDQVEARTPLSAGQPGVTINANDSITISQPGSYYLTSHHTIDTVGAHGITILASGVTLDLNGFTLSCTGVQGGSAVSLNTGVNDVTVRNGKIVGGTTYVSSTWTYDGWAKGVTSVAGATGLAVEDLTIRGVREDGIALPPDGSQVRNCRIHTVGGNGITAQEVSGCVVIKARFIGIWVNGVDGTGSVHDSIGESVNSHGIQAIGGTVSHSTGRSNFGSGIVGLTVVGCVGVGSGISHNGILCSTAQDCRATGTNCNGLSADVATNCVGQATTAGHQGITVTGTATGCRGIAPSGNVAINAAIAIGCTSGGGTITAPQKHLGTP